MEYRRFGQTNLNLSVFSLGIMHCCHSELNLEATVKQALSLGINHLEFARSYGKSELYLGNVLKTLNIPRSEIILTTKLLPTPDYDQPQTWLNESLAHLQTSYLDCIAVHGVNTWEHLSYLQHSHGCIKALQQAKAEGKVRHLGFSTHGSLELILATIETGLFEFVNLHYYYFFQRHAPVIDLARELDLGIFIISPADKGGRLYNPPDKLQQLCHPLSPLEFNYRFLLDNPAITTLSIGPANPEELIIPLEPVGLESRDKLSCVPEISRKIETELSQNLGSEQCKQCYQCLPCPENINIPEILRLRNLAVGLDMTEYGQYRYRMLENAGHWFWGNKGNKCTNCGDCLPRCPENLNIPELLNDTHLRLNGASRRRLWE
jgi:predicted aldo/keto reductase-like oxidoreductase